MIRLSNWNLMLPFLGTLAVLLLGVFFFSGCYTLSQGVTMLGYLGRAVPLEDLSAGQTDPEEAEKTRLFVEEVLSIRRFAMEELGLKESKNYTRYVQLDMDYLAAVVSASAKDAFVTYEWWFPVVGKVPYKGFFNADDARKEGAKLAKKDLDVWIRRVDAFSTLGWFSDPLYSYMRDYPVYELADLIIHELLHATVYLKGQSRFNEELAEFVGSRGAALYVEQTYGRDSAEYRSIEESKIDNETYIAFIKELIAELEALYTSALPREEKLVRKEEIIRSAQERFAADYDRRFKSDRYRGFSALKVNNAYLDLFRLYHGDREDTFFEDLLQRSGGSLRAFIAAAKTLRGNAPGREQLEEALP